VLRKAKKYNYFYTLASSGDPVAEMGPTPYGRLRARRRRPMVLNCCGFTEPHLPSVSMENTGMDALCRCLGLATLEHWQRGRMPFAETAGTRGRNGIGFRFQSPEKPGRARLR